MGISKVIKRRRAISAGIKAHKTYKPKTSVRNAIKQLKENTPVKNRTFYDRTMARHDRSTSNRGGAHPTKGLNDRTPDNYRKYNYHSKKETYANSGYERPKTYEK